MAKAASRWLEAVTLSSAQNLLAGVDIDEDYWSLFSLRRAEVGQFEYGRIVNWKTDSPVRIFAGWRKACLHHHCPPKNSYRCGAAPRVRCTAQSRLNTKTD